MYLYTTKNNPKHMLRRHMPGPSVQPSSRGRCTDRDQALAFVGEANNSCDALSWSSALVELTTDTCRDIDHVILPRRFPFISRSRDIPIAQALIKSSKVNK